jgi:hypothetical protein
MNHSLRYLTSIPRELPSKGSVLVHNNVAPQPELGMNGFRAWAQTLDDTLEPCPCGWAGLVHYRVKTKRSDLPGRGG